ncbi:prepilin-type N-terminal cleavage/methylation domain-containing protein [Colwellia psychrerythraea]|uniref:MSHA pilin protein MshD n=1 Tax=Colwellia psychrerythraea (strain 34H / ATCC BAA-681) TaxID=167879 RepID=Q47VF7_COLP3|nr:prepilin-type N-terminal cleavage/methylation domain-containing protein [Colwellia psychrerythraea]AAZ25895.1 MSHA pilin protein MshD [Colwellia psychrerythraea 34H]
MLFKYSETATPYSKHTSGFTLIEIIIGIVALSISLSIVSTLIAPAEQKSADQIHQVKAAELGQSFLNDISARAFDQNSDMAGGLVRCGEPNDGSNPCTDSGKLGPEDGNDGRPNNGEVKRGLFNDVDDFHNYSEKFTGNDEILAKGYNNFTIDIKVIYDGLSLGLSNNRSAKKITVSVTTPLGTEIQFATHKANF